MTSLIKYPNWHTFNNNDFPEEGKRVLVLLPAGENAQYNWADNLCCVNDWPKDIQDLTPDFKVDVFLEEGFWIYREELPDVKDMV